MLCAKNRPIGQVSCINLCICLYCLSRDSHLLLQAGRSHGSSKKRTSQESRGGEGMSDTAIWPRSSYLPHIADYFLNLILSHSKTGCHR